MSCRRNFGIIGNSGSYLENSSLFENGELKSSPHSRIFGLESYSIRLMASLKPDCTYLLQRKAGSGSQGPPSLRSRPFSPVHVVEQLSRKWAFVAYFAAKDGEVSLQLRLAGEGEGFEPPVRFGNV
jgi:hypothetical protein